MKDSAQGGASVQFRVARTLCKSAWGKVQPPCEGSSMPRWELAHEELSWGEVPKIVPPSASGPTEISVLLTYEAFLKMTYPKDNETATSSPDNELIRNDLISRFTESGQPGEKFATLFGKLQEALALPDGAKRSLEFSCDDLAQKVRAGKPLWDETEGLNEEQKMLRICYAEGMYHILPSFFQTLIALDEKKRDFGVVFHTSGEKIDQVVWEFNRFCEGQHPCFNGKNGSPLVLFNGNNGTRDLRIKAKSQKSDELRLSDNLDEAKIIAGESDQTTHQIVFEGKIEAGDESNVDTRDYVSKERKLSNNKKLEKYVVRVDPLQVIMDSEYFLNMIEGSE